MASWARRQRLCNYSHRQKGETRVLYCRWVLLYTYYILQQKGKTFYNVFLTCSQGQGTNVYVGQQPGNVSAGTPQTAPAEPGHPGWRGHPLGPVSPGTAGTQCPPDSLISQCAGTGGGSQCTFGGNRRWAVGSGNAADWAGTVGTPPGVHPRAAPGRRRRGTGHRWSLCWPRPRSCMCQDRLRAPQPLLADLLFLFFLLQKLLILQPLLLWGLGSANNRRAADLPNPIMCVQNVLIRRVKLRDRWGYFLFHLKKQMKANVTSSHF